mmetsp:Transcript_19863/g.29475  ORF Transcript_19863/g.29475 Transcript_19863/m.29475 type:complete len:98 (-) Transcript_19863:13-306(-)
MSRILKDPIIERQIIPSMNIYNLFLRVDEWKKRRLVGLLLPSGEYLTTWGVVVTDIGGVTLHVLRRWYIRPESPDDEDVDGTVSFDPIVLCEMRDLL